MITAYYLSKEGINVVLCEKNIIGYGATLASTALLEYQVDMELYKLNKLLGNNNSRKIYELCLEAIHDIDNIDNIISNKGEFKLKDSIYYSNKIFHKSNMIKEYEARKKALFDVEYIENHDILNLYNGIKSNNCSGDIDPYKFTTYLAKYLNSLDNVRIYENTEICDIDCGYDMNECCTNNKFVITSNKIIFCTGYETTKYFKNNNSLINLNKTFIIVTKPIEKLKEYNINFTSRDTVIPYHYLRFTEDNRIIYGGEDIRLNNKMNNKEYFENLSNDKYNKLISSLTKLLKIDNIEIEYAYSATFADTTDTLPIIDEMPNMLNCFCNLGYGANGIIYSVIGAKMLKDAIRGLYDKNMKFFKLNRGN